MDSVTIVVPWAHTSSASRPLASRRRARGAAITRRAAVICPPDSACESRALIRRSCSAVSRRSWSPSGVATSASLRPRFASMCAPVSSITRCVWPTRRSLPLRRSIPARRSVSDPMPGWKSWYVAMPKKSATRSRSFSCISRSPRRNLLIHTSLCRHQRANSFCLFPRAVRRAEMLLARSRAARICTIVTGYLGTAEQLAQTCTENGLDKLSSPLIITNL